MVKTLSILLLIRARSAIGFMPAEAKAFPVRLRTHETALNSKKGNSNQDVFQQDEADLETRRSLLRSVFNAALIATTSFAGVEPSNAGLVQFPCDSGLMNTYHFLRAGESIFESQDLISTNPLFLTNREDALSPVGIDQVATACNEMMSKDINPSVVKYSIAAKSMDTANIIATEMQVGRNRLVPEYTYMDPRGLGDWNMRSLSMVEEAVWAMDDAEAGKGGNEGRPPPTDDGTANEVLSEQVIRLRQLMSILETQYSGDTILLVFGDGTSPALLMALIAGIPLNRVHELNFEPGEIRYDITQGSILNSLHEMSPAYYEKLSRGRVTLQKLRDEFNNPPPPESYPIAEVREQRGKEPKRKKETKMSRNKTEVESNTENVSRASESDSNGLLPASMLGLWAYASTQNSKESDDEQSETVAGLSHDENALIGASLIGNVVSNNEHADEGDLSLSPEIQKLENLVKTANFDIPEFAREDEKAKLQQEKVKSAKDAMDEYMNKDDGGLAWLEGLADIIEEDN